MGIQTIFPISVAVYLSADNAQCRARFKTLYNQHCAPAVTRAHSMVLGMSFFNQIQFYQIRMRQAQFSVGIEFNVE